MSERAHAVDFVVGDDFRFIGVMTGLGDMETVARPLYVRRRHQDHRVIEGLPLQSSF